MLKKIVLPVLFVAFLLVIFTHGALAATITVDQGGSGDYTTIQDAVNHASAGDTINVDSGTYAENVYIVKSGLTLIGNGLTVVDGSSGGSGGSGFYIQSAQVTVRGFKVIKAGNGFLLNQQASNCNLTDNEVTQCGYGIYLSQVSGNNLTNNDVHDNTYEGIVVQGSNNDLLEGNLVDHNGPVNIQLDASSGNTLHNNTARNAIGGENLILEDSSSGNILDSNVADTSDYDGIYVTDSNGNTLTNNNVKNCDVYGIHVDGSTGTTLTGNTADNCGQDGIYFTNSNAATVTGNTATHSQTGISMTASSVGANDIGSNTVQDNTAYGIQLLDVQGTTVQDNIVTGNGQTGSSTDAGISVESSGVTGNNNVQLIHNTVTGNHGRGIAAGYIFNGAITQNTVDNNDYEGLILYDCHDCPISNNEVNSNAYGIQATGTKNPSGVTDSVNLQFISNTVSGNTQGSGIALMNINDSLVQSNTVDSNAQQGIIILANDGCGNIQVAQNDLTGNTYQGISLQGSCNSQILNNQVNTGQSYGLQAQECHDLVISGNKLLGNVDGIAVQGVDAGSGNYDSYNVNIQSNNVTGSTNGYGVYVFDTNNTQINGNTLLSNSQDGVYVFAGTHRSTGVQITGNTINGSSVSGIYMAMVDNGLVTGNHANNSTMCGIDVEYCPGAIVTTNILDSDYYGINVYGSNGDVDSHDLTIASNTVTNSTGPGIGLANTNNSVVQGNTVLGSINAEGITIQSSNGCRNVQVSDNVVNGSYYGITFIKVYGSDISGNHINNNTNTGMRFSDCSDDSVAGNTLDHNDPGISVVGTFDTSGGTDSFKVNLTGNTINGSLTDGILYRNVGNSLIFQNTITFNHGNGIFIFNDTDPQHLYAGNGQIAITANTIDDNDNNGVYAKHAHDCQIVSNIVNNNDAAGVALEYSHQCLVEDNQVHNSNYGITSYAWPDAFGNIDTYGVTIQDNTISASSGIGENGNLSIIKDNIVQATTGFGIDAGGSASGDQIQVIGNTITGGSTSGIICWNLTNGMVSDNAVTGSEVGIEAMSSNTSTITRNTVVQNGNGIVLSGVNEGGVADSYLMTVSDNTVTGSVNSTSNGNGIILYQTNDSLVQDNIVQSNDAAGILFNGYDLLDSNDKVTGNIVTYNKGVGINAMGANGSCVFWQNTLVGNGYDSVKNTYKDAWDQYLNHWNSTVKLDYTYKGAPEHNYTGNYWGNYSGPDINTDGIGDTWYFFGSTDTYGKYIYDYYPLIQTNGVQTYSIPLVTGWNLISIPVSGTTLKESDLVNDPTMHVDMVSVFDTTSQIYDSYTGQPVDTNRTLTTDQGIFVHCTGPATLSVTGKVPADHTIPISKQWTMIGWSNSSTVKASDVFGRLGANGQMIARFDPASQSFMTYTGNVLDVDFDMKPTEGYFISSANPTNLYVGVI